MKQNISVFWLIAAFILLSPGTRAQFGKGWGKTFNQVTNTPILESNMFIRNKNDVNWNNQRYGVRVSLWVGAATNIASYNWYVNGVLQNDHNSVFSTILRYKDDVYLSYKTTGSNQEHITPHFIATKPPQATITTVNGTMVPLYNSDFARAGQVYLGGDTLVIKTDLGDMGPNAVVKWYLNGEWLPYPSNKMQTGLTINDANEILHPGDKINFVVYYDNRDPFSPRYTPSDTNWIATSNTITFAESNKISNAKNVRSVIVRTTTAQLFNYPNPGIIDSRAHTITIAVDNPIDSFKLVFDTIVLSPGARVEPGIPQLRAMKLLGQDVPLVIYALDGTKTHWTLKFDILNTSISEHNNMWGRLDPNKQLFYLTAYQAAKNVCITILDADLGVMYFQELTLSDIKDLPIDVSTFPSGIYTVYLNRGLWPNDQTTRPFIHFTKP